MTDQAVSSCKALVSLAKNHRAAGTSATAYLRPDAAFIAQMLAHTLDLPAQRARRRSAPDIASRLYRHGLYVEKPTPSRLDRQL